ncbi:MAG: flavodoxin family protein [Candidatus Abyssobacteria bacterium SURF_17]|uniref:Flavodoxin family protein n=1 Tax=Candidatus Abyssobacteria bacterium SURF_17 TaxID=2093361 RepID=A0A419EV49_9BACT|nr:MAG: flavodoxin family protein [Candidatus Abyssubacteria bacterium SURF_17]
MNQKGREMKILGFSAGSVGREGNVDRMVKAILQKSGGKSEFVKLADLSYSGCKGCVHLCARPQVCRLDDDLLPYYQEIKEADAVVVGAPVYFNSVNTLAMSFLERFFGYRHVSVPIAGKPFVLVVTGAMMLDAAEEQLRTMLGYFEVNVVDVVRFQSRVPPCFKCGRHKECTIGGLYQMLGDAAHELTITPEMFNQWEQDSDAVTALDKAAGILRNLSSA